MPNITFLIGNGFDRQLGLETGYDQFLSWYVQRPSDSKNIENFKKELQVRPNSPWWTDAEIAMGQYISNFSPETLPFYYEQIRDFKIKLAEYLEIQENKCDFSNKEALKKAFASFILNFQKDILLPRKVTTQFNQRENTEYNFITFNYTNVLNNLLKILNEPENVVYRYKVNNTFIAVGKTGRLIPVHGTLDTTIIMGVNDETQIKLPKDNMTSKLKRTLIKPQTNYSMGRSEDGEAENVIERSTVIAIYGLKLGNTDKKWRDIIARWFQNKDHFITIFDHKKLSGINKRIPEDVLDYVEEKQNGFLKQLYPDINEDQLDVLRDRVFVIDRTNYLDFNILSQNEKQLGEKGTNEKITVDEG